ALTSRTGHALRDAGWLRSVTHAWRTKHWSASLRSLADLTRRLLRLPVTAYARMPASRLAVTPTRLEPIAMLDDRATKQHTHIERSPFMIRRENKAESFQRQVAALREQLGAGQTEDDELFDDAE